MSKRMANFWGLGLSILIIVSALGFVGFRIWAKNDLCETYYSEMNRLACFASDTILPPRANR
jgi:hypothetical protein